MRQTKAQIMSGVEDSVSSRIVANNTVEYKRENGDRVIRLHETDILTFHANGATTINDGGWRTATTKERINRFLDGRSVYSDRGSWVLNVNGTTHVYKDGITIGKRGGVSGAGDANEERMLKRMIKRFCDKMRNMAVLPLPSSGDCWYCAMKTEDGTPLGDVDAKSHALGHLKEVYVHGSLIVNALRFSGHSDFVIQLVFDRKERIARSYRDFAIRAIRKYFKHSLNLS